MSTVSSAGSDSGPNRSLTLSGSTNRPYTGVLYGPLGRDGYLSSDAGGREGLRVGAPERG